MSWRDAEPLGHSVPWLIGERGLPSMSTSSPSRVYTSWPQPTAQYGQTDSVTFRPAMRAPASFVWRETACGPIPQSAARPTTGSSRSRWNARGRLDSAILADGLPILVTKELRVGDQEDTGDDEREQPEHAQDPRDRRLEEEHQDEPG